MKVRKTVEFTEEQILEALHKAYGVPVDARLTLLCKGLWGSEEESANVSWIEDEVMPGIAK